MFDNRNKLKKKLHREKNTGDIYVNTREIRYAHIGQNIGSEVYGKGEDFKRPVLVIKRIGAMVLVLPMTSQGKNNNPFYHRIDDKYFGQPSYLMLSHIKVIDKKRFIENIHTLSETDFFQLKQKLRNYYF